MYIHKKTNEKDERNEKNGKIQRQRGLENRQKE